MESLKSLFRQEVVNAGANRLVPAKVADDSSVDRWLLRILAIILVIVGAALWFPRFHLTGKIEAEILIENEVDGMSFLQVKTGYPIAPQSDDSMILMIENGGRLEAELIDCRGQMPVSNEVPSDDNLARPNELPNTAPSTICLKTIADRHLQGVRLIIDGCRYEARLLDLLWPKSL